MTRSMNDVQPGDAVPASWNETAVPRDEAITLVDLVGKAARARPDAVAVRWTDGCLTADELWAESALVASRLSREGAGPGTTVPVLVEHSVQSIIGVLGVLRTGAAYVALDSSWPIERLADVLGQAHPAAVLATARFEGSVERALWRAREQHAPIVVFGPPDPWSEEAEMASVALQWDAVADTEDLGEASGFARRGEGRFETTDIDFYVEHVATLVEGTGGRALVEIGAGAGLLAKRLAPMVRRYLAVDPSPVSVGRCRREAPDAEVRVGAALEAASSLPVGTDTVLLSSVVQFFPGLPYLRRVLDACVTGLAMGGSIVLADIVDGDRLVTSGHLSVPASWFDSFALRAPAELDVRIERRGEGWHPSIADRYDVVITKTSDRVRPRSDHDERSGGEAEEKAVLDAADPAYVIYTSGSTGRPKGVVVSHASAVNLIEWVNRRYGIGSDDRLLWVTSLAFDLSVYDIFGMLAAGGTICIPPESARQDPQLVAELMDRFRITFWDSAPALFSEVLRHADGRHADLRLIFLSGDWVPTALVHKIPEAFTHAELTVLGGATEATIWSNFHDVRGVDPAWTSIPYGRPIDNARYHILRPDGAPSAVGEPGDLHIAGTPVALGYLGAPDLTAERFVDEVGGVHGERMYRTGDRAVWRPEGLMEFLGRSDDQVKVRGHRVELGDVRAALLSCADVDDAVAFVMSSGSQLCAAVVLRASASTRDVREHLRAVLPPYMTPDLLVEIAAMPVSANGKVDRAVLGRLVQEHGRGHARTDEDDGRDHGEEAPPARTAAMLMAADAAPLGSYGIESGVSIDAELDDDTIAEAVRALLRRHGVLRRRVSRREAGFSWSELPVEEVVAASIRRVRAPVSATDADLVDLLRRSTARRTDRDVWGVTWTVIGSRTVVYVWVSHAVADGPGCARLVDELLTGLGWPGSPETTGDTRRGAVELTTDEEGWDRVAAAMPSSHVHPRMRPATHVHVPRPIDARLGLARLQAAASRLGVTPTVALMAATRVGGAKALGWGLGRITVPYAARPEDLMSIDPMPVHRTLSSDRLFGEEVSREAEALYSALELGPPPPHRVGSLTGGVIPGLPDCLVNVDETRIPERDGVRALETVTVGAPAVLSVEVGTAGLRIAVHPGILSPAQAGAVGDEIVDLLLSEDDERRSGVDVSALAPLPDLAVEDTPTSPPASAPATVEDAVLRGWQTALGRDVRADEDVLGFGLTSLDVARVAAALRKSTGADVTMRSIYESQTPRRLAVLIADAVSENERLDVLRRACREELDVDIALPDDSFADLGGHSLAAMRVVAAVRSAGWALRIGALLTSPDLRAAARTAVRVEAAVVAAPPRRGPASPAQSRAYFESQVSGSGQLYQFQTALHVHGALSPSRWRAAATEVVRRNDVLRMGFRQSPAGLERHALPVADVEVRVVELDDAGSLEQSLREHETRAWDVERGPLVSWRLLELRPDEWVISQVEHHFVHDGWSLGLLLDQLVKLYRGQDLGEPSADDSYAAWADHFAREAGALSADHAPYWADRLAGLLPAEMSPSGGHAAAVADASAFQNSIDATSRQAIGERYPEASEFSVLLACFARALSSDDASSELAIGSAVAGRPPGAERTVGMFVNTVTLRLSVDATMDELIAACGAEVAGALDHQLLPFDVVVRGWRERTGVVGGMPYGVMFSMHDAPLPELDLGGGTRAEIEYRQNGTAKAPLDVVVIQMPEAQGGGLQVVWEYDPSRYSAADVQRMGARFLAEVHRCAGGSASEIPSRMEGPRFEHRGMERIVDDIVGHRGLGLAIASSDGALSWRALSSIIRDESLPSLSEVPVERSLDFAVSALRNLRRGVPSMAIAHDQMGRLRAAGASSRDLPPECAYAVLTSGSTGTPKFVVVPRSALANHIGAMQRILGITSADVFLSCSSLSFDAIWEELLVPLSVGAPVILADVPAGLDALLDVMEDQAVTVVGMTTALFDALVHHMSALCRRIPTLLRTVVIGGEAYDSRSVMTWCGLEGAGKTRVLNTYGPAEATIMTTWQWLTSGASMLVGDRHNTVGTPTDNAVCAVKDPQGHDVPLGQVGELWIAGAGVAIGYHGGSEEAANRFSAREGRRWYRSGDVVRMDGGGVLEFIGRSDRQVKVAGSRIDPAEVEAAIEREAGVSSAVVVTDPGASETRLVAFVVGDQDLDVADVRDRLRERLPSALIPVALHLIAEMPLSRAGKVDRRALVARAAEALSVGSEAPVTAPLKDGSEQALAAIWRDVLGIHRVGPHDSFFALGGHSLAALRVVAASQRTPGLAVTLRGLLSRATLRELAAEETDPER